MYIYLYIYYLYIYSQSSSWLNHARSILDEAIVCAARASHTYVDCYVGREIHIVSEMILAHKIALAAL